MLPLQKEGILFDTSMQSPPPSKDFINLCVTTSKVIWRQWKINPYCLRPDIKVSPIEKKESHEDFLHDNDMHVEVKRVFGDHMLDYVIGLCQGNFDYISRISDPLQIYIFSYLELEDIGRLAQTSKHFNKLCDSEQLWEHFVERHCDTISEDMRQVASEKGWKTVFFTNKLQLRVQSRRQQKQISM